jgi:flagellar biosynthesis/type III secretory pathway M-ring protein FliF/YscJ
MLSDLAALTPPAIVAVAVLIGAWAIVRRELAPKRKSRAEAETARDDERAADREHGRSLYFATSPIYLDSPPGYARRFRAAREAPPS